MTPGEAKRIASTDFDSCTVMEIEEFNNFMQFNL
jgi:hypothetical protein